MKLKLLNLACLLILLFGVSSSVSAQVGVQYKRTVQVSYFNPGYLDYLPYQYNPADANVKYPLIIYFTGLGTGGTGDSTTSNGLEKLFTGSPAPHEQIRNGNWPDAFTVPSGTYRFVLVTPQYNSRNPANLNHMPSPAEVDSLITHVIASHNNKIDTTRIYLMGHSQGAGVPWEYAGASSRYASRIAAMVTVSGVMFPNLEKAWRIKYARTAVWAFHNTNDPLVPYSFSRNYVQYVNEAPQPNIPAKLTSLGDGVHDVGAAFSGNTIPGEPYNVYQWALLYQRPNTTVWGGEDVFINAPASNANLAGSDRRPSGSIISTTWTQISGPTTATIASPTAFSTSVGNLSRGAYIFRLTVTDNNSISYTDDVAVQVGPELIRIQAEAFNTTTSTTSGVVINNSPSEGNQQVVDAFGTNEWLDYEVTVPVAADYRLRIRAGAFYGNQKWMIQDGNGNRLDTVRVFPTGGFDNFLDWYATIPLRAGTQTIRFLNFSDPNDPAFIVSYFNWFEIFNEPAPLNPLPVNFAQFNLRCNNNNVELFWATSAERSLKEFQLQRSSNGTIWNTVYTAQPGAAQYRFTDPNASGSFQYRVVAVDLDGKQTFSNIARAQCGGKSSIAIFPNPVKATATLSFYLERNTPVRLSLYDARGALVKESSHQLLQGVTQLPFSMNGLAKGTYSLRAAWGDEVKTLKLIKE